MATRRNNPTRGTDPLGDFKAVGDVASGQVISFFANGMGTFKVARPDPADANKTTLGDEDGAWVRAGDQLNFKMAATAVRNGISVKSLVHKFTVEQEGKRLRRSDGLLFERQP